MGVILNVNRLDKELYCLLKVFCVLMVCVMWLFKLFNNVVKKMV